MLQGVAAASGRAAVAEAVFLFTSLFERGTHRAAAGLSWLVLSFLQMLEMVCRSSCQDPRPLPHIVTQALGVVRQCFGVLSKISVPAKQRHVHAHAYGGHAVHACCS